MATLVLTVVGTVIGGPIGGAIGAAVGSVIDHTVLFPPQGRSGPRLSALQVQTSSYGTPLQRIFGTMRVGGCVIWSTELIESAATSSSGKGQASLTAYSYSVSFAVALSARPIQRVGRIWADGKLLRGADGVFKSATGFRLYPGNEDQPIDPLLAAAEGGMLTPAHRGVAYAVFEHLQLADYGNRIPSLTFEVVADDAAVPIGTIIRELAGGAVTGSVDAPDLTGFAAYGDSVRSAIEPLTQASGAWFAPAPGLKDARLVLRGGIVPERAIDDGDVTAAGSQSARGRSIAALETVARAVTVSHYDPARDFQIGLQRAWRPGPGTREDRLELVAAVDAGAAKTIAERTIARGEAGRERRSVTLGWDALALSPGACVTIRGVAGVWRVARWGFERHVVTLECVRLAARTAAARASPGRVLSAPDLAAGTTLLAVAEMLPFDDSVLTSPRVTIVAAGTQPGWRRAAVLYSLDDGLHWISAGATAAAGVIGRLVTVPGTGGASLVDRAGRFLVELAHGDMTLESATDAALAAGANLALVGDEIVQFGIAEQIGATRWQLSTLLRGRRGSERVIGTQAVGDRFALLTPQSTMTLDLPMTAIGGTVRILATGVGDLTGPASAVLAVNGVSVVPLSPVLLQCSEVGNGNAVLAWVRRSRNGWQWRDGIDAPLAEEREEYRVTFGDEAGAPSAVTVSPRWTLTAADRGSGRMIAVRQAGTNGESPPARLWIPGWAG
ncbi:phage tail protein [Sphingomonas sp. PsM26]|nr:phage tail protein [Sphingomonas sp. PsM26]